ncbi:hypothetical protein [Mariniflexile sp. HMF6888]|uniref:hypothetical protein n=1 Tax=Mariniflexile sp. HMF6888 TaxID=3373086 RepID=UPI0037985A76
MKNSALKILTICGSVISIGFGIWHFFVPIIWNWYAYIDSDVTELVIAVRAINIFFSLLLVLLGIANLLLIFRKFQDYYSLLVVLGISTILWATRLILQIVHPQGSQNSIIQYAMLGTFILVFISFAISLIIALNQYKQPKR